MTSIIFSSIATIFFLVVFGGVLISFSTVNFSKLPTPINATLTGFPTWRGEIKNFDTQTWISMLLFTSFLQIVPGVFMIIWSKYEPLLIFVSNGEKTSTTSFNKLIAGYSIVTGITAIAVIIFDLGKLWTTFGVIHNYFEVIILILLHQKGNVALDNNIIFCSFLYILIAEGTTILLQWPYDLSWFKLQGLAVDWAFFIQFVRLYLTTRRDYKEGYISLPHHVSDDERESEEHDRPNHIHHHKKDCHLGHVFLLPLAAFWHIAGNVLNTVLSNEAFSYVDLY
ncbi:1505_t:CDS:2 [Gigaspora margarita]|uniref:1505_t:CDS:1 n=1 Tax=Gigaspora margarita TaxID=4874 RepID=A0ABN7UIW7_GIGMA|nr:1505_t:CDS:2 [Gigaspora margarita]